MAAAGLFLLFLCICVAFYLRPGVARTLPGVTHTLPLSRNGILTLFLLKLCFALAYGYIIGHFAPNSGDCWGYFTASREQAAFIHSIRDFFFWTLPALNHWTDLLHYPLWNNIKQNAFEDLLLVMNLFTLHNFYTDTLLLCALTFSGWLQFIRLLGGLFPGYPSWSYILPFLPPSFLFFCNGLHPDSIAFALLGYISLDVYRVFHGEGGRRTLIRLIICLCLLALFKIFLVMFLLPILVGGWLVSRHRALLTGWSVMVVGTVSILAASLQDISLRQQMYFFSINHSAIAATPLEATFSSMVTHLPDAILNGFLYPLSGTSLSLLHPTALLYLISGMEMLLLWALFIYGSIKRVRWRWSFYEAGLIYFAGINLLLIGYTVPVLGALVRYRSLFLPFLLGMLLFPLLRARKVIIKK